MNTYDEIYDSARRDISEASKLYAATVKEAAAARNEHDAFVAERDGLRNRLDQFEAGTLVIPVDEYMTIGDRLRWLDTRLRHSKAALDAAVTAQTRAGQAREGVRGKYRRLVADQIRDDCAALEKQRVAELEEALR